MAADKESLRTEVSELFTQLGAQIKKDKQHTLEEGRPFAIMRWLSGSHDLQKYPPGPAFVVRFPNFALPLHPFHNTFAATFSPAL